jgi:hypothetical protein
MNSASDQRTPAATDSTLRSWARRHGFTVREREHWDAHLLEVIAIDSGGDQYQFFASTDHPAVRHSEGEAVVGVALLKRGGVKHHAFYRERKRFTFEQTVPLVEVQHALDVALQVALTWVKEAGHAMCGD